MKKVSNTFNKGLIMDVSPLSTTGDSLSDCLNGTFCTMNGDELVLQNDMGNGRVQTAYLPKGYIPIGTTQLGGIIYIASYNPFTNKCQIGSFPSPQRTSDKRDKLEKEIPLDKDENIIRVVLSDEIFKPGDKFYLTIPGQYMNYKYTETSDNIDAVKQHFLKFSVAIISEEAQIIKLNEDPIIEEPKNNTEDDFTKDINKFKVCTSKISGKLILIIERVTFDYSINFNAFGGTNSENKKTFYLNFNLNANSQDKFFPNRLELTSLCEYANTLYSQKLIFPTEGKISSGGDFNAPILKPIFPTEKEFTSGNFNDFHSFQYSAKNIYNNNVIDPVTAIIVNKPGGPINSTTISKLIERLTNSGYWNKVNNPVYLKIQATLYTNNFKINSEGEKIGECLPAATKQYVIDLSKVASSTVELSRYTYTIVDGSPISAEITFALQTYLDSAYEIKNITVTIYNVKEDSVNKVDSKSLGTSVKPVNFENLDNNYLYLVEFQIKTGRSNPQENESLDEKIINIYRYLYSNPNIVASFDKKLTDYKQAVPTLTLEAKVIDEKLIPDNPSSSEINYPNGLASTDDTEFIGTEKQIWKLKDKVSISITEKNNIPVEIISITANNKKWDKYAKNLFLIDTGLQNQELKFNYKYNSSQAVQKTCNILERVSDYLLIAKRILIAQYPGWSHDAGSGLNEDLFEILGGNTFSANTFKRFYNDGSYAEDYSSELYGYYLNGHYTIYPIQFQVRSESQDNYYVTDTLIQNSNITGTYLIKPGDGTSDMLFSLYEPSMNEEYNWELQSEYLRDIFNVLYTYREKQLINIRYAESIQKEETKIISINKSIETSNVDIDLTTLNNELFIQLAEKYDIYYSKNNYKNPIINNLKITLNETKSDIKSTLLKSYPITIDSSNDVLLKSNNKLYRITHYDLHNNKIYTAQIQDIENIIISDSFNVTLHDGLTYNGVAKQFYAVKGKLYMKSLDRTEYIRMGTQNYIRIELPIETAHKNNVIK